MIRRVARSRDGLTEGETISLVHAFVISRIAYALPYQALTNQEIMQATTIIRKAFKDALGLPECARTERFEGLGLHNTFDEYAVATLYAHKERLCSSTQGREVLARLGFTLRPQYCGEETAQIDGNVRSHIAVAPIPKNMHPKYHPGLRRARAKTLHKLFGMGPGVYYADASRTSSDTFTVVSIVSNNVTTASFKTSSACVAEAATIALAIQDA